MAYTNRSTFFAIAMACLVIACERAPTAETGSAAQRVAMSAMVPLPTAAAGLPIVACPPVPPQEVSAVIGPDGGSLVLGPFWLRVPEGALASPSQLTMTRPAGAHLVVKIEISNSDQMVLSRAAELTIRYGHCSRQDLTRRAVRIVRLEEAAPSVESSHDVVEQDESNGTFTLLTTRFSTFAVAY